MKKLLLFALIINALHGFGQSFKRQAISSLGTNHIMYSTGAANSCTSITLGQPPNAGTIVESGGILRQGFQQPNNDACNIAISFNFLETSLLGCGVYYDFEYTGNIDPTTTISWQFGPNASPMIGDGPAPGLVGFSTVGPQEITITVSNDKCQKSATQFVNSNGTPFLATTTKVDAWCYGDKGSIDLTVANPTPPVEYEWSTGKKTEDLDNLIPGEYSYTATDANGCKAEGTVEIEGSDQPLIIDAHILDEICTESFDGSVELMVLNANQPVEFSWSTGEVGATVDSLTKGTYSVTIADAKGCKIDSTFEIRTFCELEAEDFIPNTFSPNGDNFNEIWNVEMIDRFPNHTVLIYNRWGNLVREYSGNFMGWDGTNEKGEEMQIGAYYFVIELNDATGKVFKGAITLVR